MQEIWLSLATWSHHRVLGSMNFLNGKLLFFVQQWQFISYFVFKNIKYEIPYMTNFNIDFNFVKLISQNFIKILNEFLTFGIKQLPLQLRWLEV